jgi:hypothetical protein
MAAGPLERASGKGVSALRPRRVVFVAALVCFLGLGLVVAAVTSGGTADARPRVMLGLFSQLPGRTELQSVELREQQLGRGIVIDSHYYDWTDPFPGDAERADIQAGRTPMITWWGIKYAPVLDGSQDQLILSRARGLRELAHEVLLRWGPEMNGWWYQTGGAVNGNNPDGYVATWRHLHDLFVSAGATNVSWVWAPNSVSQPGGENERSWNNWRHYYPGDDYVDWVGIDGYNWGSAASGSSWRWPAEIFDPVYNDYAGRKPIMLAETASVEEGGDKAEWIRRLQDWFEHRPAAQALVWFDTDESRSRYDWRIDSSPQSMAAFRSLSRTRLFEAGLPLAAGPPR